MLHESLRPELPAFFPVEKDKQQRVLGGVRLVPSRKRQHAGRARRVVIGPVEDLVVTHAEVVVVRRDDDVAIGLFRPAHESHEIDPRDFRSGARLRGERAREAVERREPRPCHRAQQERARPLAARSSDAASLHGVGGERPDVGEELRRIDGWPLRGEGRGTSAEQTRDAKGRSEYHGK